MIHRDWDGPMMPGRPGSAKVAGAPLAIRLGVKYLNRLRGKVAERLKAPHSKCGVRATVPGVRIPPFPPTESSGFNPADFARRTSIYHAQTFGPVPGSRVMAHIAGAPRNGWEVLVISNPCF